MNTPGLDGQEGMDPRDALLTALAMIDHPSFHATHVHILFVNTEGSNFQIKGVHGGKAEYLDVIPVLRAYELICFQKMGILPDTTKTGPQKPTPKLPGGPHS